MEDAIKAVHQARDWLTNNADPKATKHLEWTHPAVACLLHYSIVVPAILAAHDLLLATYPTDECSHETPSAILLFLVIYNIWFVSWRLLFYEPQVYRPCVLYEYCWLCNVTLVLSAIGLWTKRPIIPAAACICVGIDQLLWYVDLSTYMLFGVFPIGVSKYIFWKGTTWTTRITCTHHLWTIPLVLYATNGMHVLAYPLALFLMVANVLLSRCLTPQQLVAENVDPKYLNVNLSYALWKDIKFGFLQINYDDPPVLLYMVRLLTRWQAFNTLVFCVLYYTCQALSTQPAPVC